MGMTDSKQNLDRAYGLGTAEDTKALYADWADTYDTEFVAAIGYILHEQVVAGFLKAGGAVPVLDIGAGTGACGEVFARANVGPVDGTDISAEMLQVAAKKESYRALFDGDILAGLDAPDGTYAGVVSAGTFTLGHVGPDGLDEVVRLLAPGGLAVIAVRDVHFEAAGFEAKLEQLSAHLSRRAQVDVRIYSDAAPDDHRDDRAILLHLWKA